MPKRIKPLTQKEISALMESRGEISVGGVSGLILRARELTDGRKVWKWVLRRQGGLRSTRYKMTRGGLGRVCVFRGGRISKAKDFRKIKSSDKSDKSDKSLSIPSPYRVTICHSLVTKWSHLSQKHGHTPRRVFLTAVKVYEAGDNCGAVSRLLDVY